MPLDEIKDVVKAEFGKQQGVIAVLLYGSYAKGTAQPDSDVDIAVLFQPESIPSFSELWDIRNNLAEALGSEVDLICLNKVGPIISSQVYKYHQSLLVRDKRMLEKYFMRLIVDYAELKEFRKEMEERILERKFYDRS